MIDYCLTTDVTDVCRLSGDIHAFTFFKNPFEKMLFHKKLYFLKR